MLTTLNFVGFFVSLVALAAFIMLLVSSFKRHILWGIAVLLIPFGTLIYGIKYWNQVKKPFLAYIGANVLSIAIVFYAFNQMGGMELIDMAQKINDGTMTEQDAAIFMQNTMNNIEDMGGGGKDEMLAQMRADPNVTEEDIKMMEAMFNQIDSVAAGEVSSFEEGWDEKVNQASQESTAADIPAAVEEKAEEQIEDDPLQLAAIMNTQKKTEPEESLAEEVDQDIQEELAPVEEPAPPKKTSGYIKVSEAKDYVGEYVYVTTKEGVTHNAMLMGVKGGDIHLERRTFGGALTFKLPYQKVDTIKLK